MPNPNQQQAFKHDVPQFFISGPRASAIVYDIKHVEFVIQALCKATGDDEGEYTLTALPAADSAVFA